MGVLSALGIMILLPITLLLVVSFFVLFTVRKTDAGAFKIFGYVIIALLWVSAAVIFLAGTSRLIMGSPLHQGPHMMKGMGQMKSQTPNPGVTNP